MYGRVGERGRDPLMVARRWGADRGRDSTDLDAVQIISTGRDSTAIYSTGRDRKNLD